MKRFYLMLVWLCRLPVGLLAQTRISGIVLDETGEGAIGANVVVEGTTIGTVTDFDGQFELNVPDGKKNVVISYLGYKTVTVPAKPNMKVTLQTESQQIQEVVVTGMYQQDKRLNTGSIVKLISRHTAPGSRGMICGSSHAIRISSASSSASSRLRPGFRSRRKTVNFSVPPTVF